MYQKIVGCSKFHIQHISQDQIEKLKNFGYSPRRRDNFNGTITKSERGIQS